jgi:class 3 adenylate cyclase
VLIKTMGDAVMAAFVDAAACARGAIEVLARFEAFRNAMPNGDRLSLKIGMYAGACYVVTANGVLDYFGQTVNVAARIQHLAGAGELVMPHDLFEGLPAPDLERLHLVERFEATVKGVDHPLDLVRTMLASSDSQAVS